VRLAAVVPTTKVKRENEAQHAQGKSEEERKKGKQSVVQLNPLILLMAICTSIRKLTIPLATAANLQGERAGGVQECG
jgi:hypothetical protein